MLCRSYVVLAALLVSTSMRVVNGGVLGLSYKQCLRRHGHINKLVVVSDALLCKLRAALYVAARATYLAIAGLATAQIAASTVLYARTRRLYRAEFIALQRGALH